MRPLWPAQKRVMIQGLLNSATRRAYLRFIGQVLAGCCGVAFLTGGGFALHFNAATMGFLYLLVAASVSILYGFWQASVTSMAAVLCLDYLFEQPLFVFSIADPQDWIALCAFEMSALIVSRLSSKEQRNSREAVLQRKAMEKLYELSRSTLLLDLHQAPGPQLVQLIHSIFDAKAVALFDANLSRLDSVGEWSLEEQDLARECYMLDASHDDPVRQVSQRVLRLDTHSIGAIVIRGEVSPLIVNALASLAAVAIERYRSFEKESRIEAAHRSEQLRVAVLDSLAHAVKTPLTAIRTASSGLLEVGGLNPSQSELVTLIDDEVVQLNELCTRLLQTAKLDAAQMTLGRDDVILADVITQVVTGHAEQYSGHALRVSIADPTITVCGDRELLAMILAQFVDNAIKYSFPGSPIDVSARKSISEVVISVHNEGPAIRIQDRELIFERFYRSPETKHMAAGTGIGLSIARKAAEAHKGHVWVISDEREGTTFFLSLPQSARRTC